jgi:hypothetical protein
MAAAAVPSRDATPQETTLATTATDAEAFRVAPNFSPTDVKVVDRNGLPVNMALYPCN